MKTSKIFVTGTDTDIGKTIVSAGLCLVWPSHYWKPIQSGTYPTTDKDIVAQFLPKSHIYPSAYVLKKPASPNQAARVENKKLIKTKMLFSRFQKQYLLPPPKRLIIEGAGGLLVPFNNKENIRDLILAEKADVILVARSSLGTLNHTFLTLEALRAKNIRVLGVILVGPLHVDNKRDIKAIGKVPILLELPILKKITKRNLKKYFMRLKAMLP